MSATDFNITTFESTFYNAMSILFLVSHHSRMELGDKLISQVEEMKQPMALDQPSTLTQTIKLKSLTISSEEGASQNHITSTACCAGYLIGPCRIEDMGFYSALFLMFF